MIGQKSWVRWNPLYGLDASRGVTPLFDPSAAPGEETERPRVSFVEVYSANYRRLVEVARFTTGSLVLAEELVQDAFVDLYRRFDDVAQPEAYLRRAVMSRCTSWVRRVVVERRHGERSDPIPAAGRDPVDREVVDAVASLPTARLRAVIVLRYFADWSEHDIATALGCRPGTVKSLLSRARSMLERKLSNDR